MIFFIIMMRKTSKRCTFFKIFFQFCLPEGNAFFQFAVKQSINRKHFKIDYVGERQYCRSLSSTILFICVCLYPIPILLPSPDWQLPL